MVSRPEHQYAHVSEDYLSPSEFDEALLCLKERSIDRDVDLSTIYQKKSFFIQNLMQLQL